MSGGSRKKAAALNRAEARRADAFDVVSDELLENLGLVAMGLEHATKVTDESSYVPLIGNRLLNELGLALLKIKRGADARRVFRQNGRSKPKMGFDHTICARAYWIQRALDPSAPVSTAIVKAKKVSGLNVTSARIQRLARDLREQAFREIESDIRQGFGPGAILTLEQLAALRGYLRQKSKGQRAANS
jgi:hypothetical protein